MSNLPSRPIISILRSQFLLWVLLSSSQEGLEQAGAVLGSRG